MPGMCIKNGKECSQHDLVVTRLIDIAITNELSRMAEAKERVLTPAIPSDMQSVLKRCEILEKEARSLKLNLSFMNR